MLECVSKGKAESLAPILFRQKVLLGIAVIRSIDSLLKEAAQKSVTTYYY